MLLIGKAQKKKANREAHAESKIKMKALLQVTSIPDRNGSDQNYLSICSAEIN